MSGFVTGGTVDCPVLRVAAAGCFPAAARWFPAARCKRDVPSRNWEVSSFCREVARWNILAACSRRLLRNAARMLHHGVGRFRRAIPLHNDGAWIFCDAASLFHEAVSLLRDAGSLFRGAVSLLRDGSWMLRDVAWQLDAGKTGGTDFATGSGGLSSGCCAGLRVLPMSYLRETSSGRRCIRPAGTKFPGAN